MSLNNATNVTLPINKICGISLTDYLQCIYCIIHAYTMFWSTKHMVSALINFIANTPFTSIMVNCLFCWYM